MKVTSLPNVREEAPTTMQGDTMNLMIGYSLRGVGEVQDCTHLMNIDRKSTEFPYDFEDWQQLNLMSDWFAFLTTYKNTPCGFVIYELSTCLRVHRLAVLPEFRHQGVGVTLLSIAETNAGNRKLYEIPVPETSCRGGDDPYDVSKWLSLRGYKCEETVEGMFFGYGKDIDGFIFRKKIT